MEQYRGLSGGVGAAGNHWRLDCSLVPPASSSVPTRRKRDQPSGARATPKGAIHPSKHQRTCTRHTASHSLPLGRVSPPLALANFAPHGPHPQLVLSAELRAQLSRLRIEVVHPTTAATRSARPHGPLPQIAPPTASFPVTRQGALFDIQQCATGDNGLDPGRMDTLVGFARLLHHPRAHTYVSSRLRDLFPRAWPQDLPYGKLWDAHFHVGWNVPRRKDTSTPPLVQIGTACDACVALCLAHHHSCVRDPTMYLLVVRTHDGQPACHAPIEGISLVQFLHQLSPEPVQDRARRISKYREREHHRLMETHVAPYQGALRHAQAQDEAMQVCGDRNGEEQDPYDAFVSAVFGEQHEDDSDDGDWNASSDGDNTEDEDDYYISDDEEEGSE